MTLGINSHVNGKKVIYTSDMTSNLIEFEVHVCCLEVSSQEEKGTELDQNSGANKTKNLTSKKEEKHKNVLVFYLHVLQLIRVTEATGTGEKPRPPSPQRLLWGLSWGLGTRGIYRPERFHNPSSKSWLFPGASDQWDHFCWERSSWNPDQRPKHACMYM